MSCNMFNDINIRSIQTIFTVKILLVIGTDKINAVWINKILIPIGTDYLRGRNEWKYGKQK